ncbi:MAG: hypothetical protein HY270_22755 [Deltaproteobacteria bacterium]|nr:hypothetical protein [Deltaproteobacteria bacterium]
MKRWMFAIIVSVALLTVAWSVTNADDSDTAKPAAAQPAQILPLDGSSTAGGCIHDGGCMPGGGCCGGCADKAAAQDKPADAQAEGGGCPCMHNKQKPAS